MKKYGIIPDYLHCPYRDHQNGFCIHPEVQKPGYFKSCCDRRTLFVATKNGKKIDFPDDCPLNEVPPCDCDKCNGRILKDLHIDCLSCSKFKGIYKPNTPEDEWGVHPVCGRGGCEINGSLMLNCFSYEEAEE